MAVATTPFIGHGSTISYSTDAGSTYTAAALVTEIKPPKETTKEVDTTHLASANFTEESIPGLNNGGEVGFTFELTAAQYVAVRALRRTLPKWKIQIPDGSSSSTGSTFTFDGYIKELGMMIPNDDKCTCECSIKVTANPVFASGS